VKFKKALTAIRSGDWQEARDQMLDSRWAKQVPRRAEDLAGVMLLG
jgi:lysozyme